MFNNQCINHPNQSIMVSASKNAISCSLCSHCVQFIFPMSTQGIMEVLQTIFFKSDVDCKDILKSNGIEQ